MSLFILKLHSAENLNDHLQRRYVFAIIQHCLLIIHLHFVLVKDISVEFPDW